MRTDVRSTCRFLWLLVLPFLVSGCAIAKRVGSPSTEVALRVRTAQPQHYLVRVAGQQSADYPVAADGLVKFTVPAFAGGCDMYLFDVIKIQDGSAEKLRVVEVRHEGRVIRRLSLSQIANLMRDEAGYSIVRVGE